MSVSDWEPLCRPIAYGDGKTWTHWQVVPLFDGERPELAGVNKDGQQILLARLCDSGTPLEVCRL